MQEPVGVCCVIRNKAAQEVYLTLKALQWVPSMWGRQLNAWTFSGSTAIPCLETMNPKRRPAITINTHLSGFKQMLYYQHRSKMVRFQNIHEEIVSNKAKNPFMSTPGNAGYDSCNQVDPSSKWSTLLPIIILGCICWSRLVGPSYLQMSPNIGTWSDCLLPTQSPRPITIKKKKTCIVETSSYLKHRDFGCSIVV